MVIKFSRIILLGDMYLQELTEHFSIEFSYLLPFFVSPRFWSAIHLQMLLRLAVLCLQLSPLHSICSVIIEFSKQSFLVMCRRNSHSLFLMPSMCPSLILPLKIRDCLHSVHGILSIILSVDSRFFFICEHSQP